MAEQATGTEATISDQTELDTLREGIDDPMVLKGQLAKEADARRQITARAKKAEQDLREYKLSHPEPSTEIITPPPQSSVVIDEAVELRLDGYNKQETEWIMKNGGREVLKDPNSLVSIAIKAQREQRKAEEAASAVSSTVGLSEVERKFTPEQLRNMSVKELEAILPHSGN